MKKSTMRWWVVLAVLLVVYNVVAFAVPFPKNAVFFVSWGFTLLALGAQIYVIRTAFYQEEGAKSKFYGFPIARIGVVYLIVQTALSLIFMVLGFAVSVPVWVPLLLYVVLLGASALGLVSAETTRDEIVRQDAGLKKDVSHIRALQSKMAAMVSVTQDDAVRAALEKLTEDIRFSDPVSSAALEAVEGDLAACIDDLQQAVVDNDREGALALERKCRVLLVERNRVCRLEK